MDNPYLDLVMALDGRNLSEVARASGVPQSTVSRVHSASRLPGLLVAQKLARGLGMRLVLLAPGKGRVAACGHKVLPPDAARGYTVTCSTCERKYEWVTVEVQG